MRHDTDDETASISSNGTLSSKSSVSSKTSRSSKKKSKSKDSTRDKSSQKKMKNRKKESKPDNKAQNEPTFEAAQVFKTNARKIQMVVALKKRFGLCSKELVQREERSDREYRRRSMDLTATFMENPESLRKVYDWSMPLLYEPPENKEPLKSCIARKTSTHQKAVHWPSSFEVLCHVTCVVGYDESMLGSCFYNGSDFNNFRLDKFIEDHSDEYELVSEEEEYEEIEEEIIYEYIEEEIIEEVPIKPFTSRRGSM